MLLKKLSMVSTISSVAASTKFFTCAYFLKPCNFVITIIKLPTLPSSSLFFSHPLFLPTYLSTSVPSLSLSINQSQVH